LCAPSRFGEYRGGRTSARIEFDEPTNDTGALLSAARTLFEGMYKRGIPYKKAGATVSGLIPEEYVAGSLFNTPKEKADRGVYSVVDRINERFGRNAVHPAVISNVDAWASNAKLRSPDYTTRWSDIPSIKAV
jgi:DNA polymerase V